MVKIYKTGTRAKTVIGNIEGIITGICIYSERIQYQFSYFKDGKRYSEWVDVCELIFNKSARQNKIGYNNH